MRNLIARFKAARDAQAAALVAKGVQVPDGAGFEDFPALTEAIAAGGTHEMEDGLVSRTVTEYTNDRVTEIGGYAFCGYTNIVSVSFPNVTSFSGSNVFQNCKNLLTVNLPKLEKAGAGNEFTNCKALKRAQFPRLLRGGLAFQSCKMLEYLDFGRDATEEEYSAHMQMHFCSNCEALKTIVLRYNKVLILANVNSFTNSPFDVGGTGGVVYVPQAMIAKYQAATNWSVLYEAGTCTFLPIEGSEYE